MRFVLALLLLAATAHAEDSCPTVTVSMMPSDGLQIVAWVEDAAGNYVDTVFVTQSTGVFGIGNRAGRMGMRSGPLWPYGKRLDVFPIWSHRHGIAFPMVTWQNPELEVRDLDAAFVHSSRDLHFCRPLMPDEAQWDTGTCASTVFTDKGAFSTATIGYPPRADVDQQKTDSDDVLDYATLNPFDTISRATPAGGAVFAPAWSVPVLPAGNYVLRVEVSKEFDMNATYNETTQPPPAMNWPEYGLPYRGQPSVVYDVPFAIGAADATAQTAAYAGYGDPDGLDGNVRVPDGTIDVDIPGSGGARLLLAPDATPYRVRVDFAHGDDTMAPSAVIGLQAKPNATSVELAFAAAGDDAASGTVKRYEVRYRAGEMDEQSFESSTAVEVDITPVAAGERQTIVIDGLAPRTPYSVGIRAFDECQHPGPLVITTFTTTRSEDGVGCCNTSGASNAPLVLMMMFLFRRRRTTARAA